MKNAFSAYDPEHIEATQCIKRQKPVAGYCCVDMLFGCVQLFFDGIAVSDLSCIVHGLQQQFVSGN